jgi:hypothetical protein
LRVAAAIIAGSTSRRVVAAAGANLQHAFARLRCDGAETARMQARLAVVQVLLGQKRKDPILIEQNRIGARRRDGFVAVADIGQPGTRAEEILSRDLGEDVGDARIGGSDRSGHQVAEETARRGERVHVSWS